MSSQMCPSFDYATLHATESDAPQPIAPKTTQNSKRREVHYYLEDNTNVAELRLLLRMNASG